MEGEPLVSVVMPAYNAAAFIEAAIESVLAQTYPHFELWIIDDGSTDGTPAILSAYRSRDPRIKIADRPHSGVVASRNHGLDLAQGAYLAWLDADDLALPHRLEAQVAALKSDPGLVIVGSAFRLLHDQGTLQAVQQMPESDTSIRWHCLFHSPFAQSSVMLRLEALRSRRLGYDPAMKEAEDYDLWSRLLQHGRGRNLPEPLLSYRLHPAQASHRGQTKVWEYASQVSQRNLAALGAHLPLEQVHRLREWYYRFPPRFLLADLPLAQALLDILNRFSRQPGLEAAEVRRLRGRWLGRLLRAGALSGQTGWFLRWLRQLSTDDLGAILAYLARRKTQ
jgi:glycosyltransferase involved in cell wall biosynthesis